MTTFIQARTNIFTLVFILLSVFNLNASTGLPVLELPLENADRGTQLEKGTPITLKVFKGINSGEVVVGDIVEMTVHTEIIVNGEKTLMATGHYAEGRVTRVRKAGSFGRSGFIEIEATSARAVDGQIIPLEGKMIYRFGKNRKGMAFGTSIGIPVVGVMLGAPLLVAFATVGIFVKGKEAIISPDTLIPAKVAQDARIL